MWLIHMFDVSHSYAWRESLFRVTWLVHICEHDSFIRVTWLVHICDMNRFMCVAWLIHVCDINHSCVWRGSVISASHLWMSPVTHMNKSCHTHELVMSRKNLWYVRHCLFQCVALHTQVRVKDIKTQIYKNIETQCHRDTLVPWQHSLWRYSTLSDGQRYRERVLSLQ